MNREYDIDIYEFFSSEGLPSQYVCSGHINSEIFRDECEKQHFIKPLVIQHRWQQTKRVPRKNTGKKFTRGYTANVSCFKEEPGAKAVTVGLID